MASEPRLVPFVVPRADTAFALTRPQGLTAAAYQTWSTRFWWRHASCAEALCEAHQNGWSTTVDEGTQLGREQADYIRFHSARRFTETREAGVTVFRFPPGQTCFDTRSREHQIQADREPVFVRQAGHLGALLGAPQVYERGDQFADDLHTFTDNLSTVRSRAGTAG